MHKASSSGFATSRYCYKQYAWVSLVPGVVQIGSVGLGVAAGVVQVGSVGLGVAAGVVQIGSVGLGVAAATAKYLSSTPWQAQYIYQVHY